MKERSSKQKRAKLGQVLLFACFCLIGAACGVCIPMLLESSALADAPMGTQLMALAALLVGMYVLMLLHIILHEGGHLLFGLLTGYRFSSFRIGSLMWVREDGRLRLRRLSIAGTGGQCLMAPPAWQEGSIPVVWYNLGGCIVNAAVGALSVVGALLASHILVVALFIISAIIGFAYALINGLPLSMLTVNNDGSNARSLRRNREACRAFWVQLAVNERIAAGARLRELPAEWFELPPHADLSNSMVATIEVFACNRLMDEGALMQANARMKQLLERDTAIIGLHAAMLRCDRIFCELVGDGTREEAEALLTAELTKFMKSMKNYPSILRTEYTVALCLAHDEARAARAMARFDKISKTYPYPHEIESERELMQLARQKAAS